MGAIVQIIDFDHAGQRLDNYLMSQLKGVPKTRVYKAIRKGEVRVNGGRCKPTYKLALSDKVRVPPIRQAEASARIQPQMHVSEALRNSIIFEDDQLIVIDKPAGLPVHGGSGFAGGVIEILRLLKPKQKFLELVHRLDKGTSGCLLVAKKRCVLLALHHLLRAHKIEKIYVALVKGHWSKRKSKVDLPLRKNQQQSGERVVKVDESGKAAVSHFKLLQRFATTSLVEVQLETGRTHQIRVHASTQDHPIVGDTKYGDKDFNKAMRHFGVRRMCLHARRLRFTLEGKRYDFCAPLPLFCSSNLLGFLRQPNLR